MLSQEEKNSEFTMKIITLLTEGQKFDKIFLIETIEVGNSKGGWMISAQVPFKFGEKGEISLIPENAKFKQVKPWGKNATKVDGAESDPQGPEAYFTFCLSCDDDPQTILQRPEWRRQGSNQMELTELSCFNEETPLVLYFVHNKCNEQSIVSELSKILEQARNEEKENNRYVGVYKQQCSPNVNKEFDAQGARARHLDVRRLVLERFKQEEGR